MIGDYILSSIEIEEQFPLNFIKSVSCELKFPVLLKIEKYIPEYQELIRDNFPGFSISRGPSFAIGPKEIIEKEISFEELSDYGFSNEKEGRTVKIKSNAIVLTFAKFNIYDEFESTFFEIVDKFIEILDIGYFSRLGLRYINHIPLNIDLPITNQLVNNFNCIISDDNLQAHNNLVGLNSVIRWSTEDNYTINLANQIGNDPIGKPIYVIDLDVYQSGVKVSPNDYKPITKKLHNLLIPEFHKNIKDPFKEVLRGNQQWITQI